MSIGVPAGSLTSRLGRGIDASVSAIDCDCWTGLAAVVSTVGLWAKTVTCERRAVNNSEVSFLTSESPRQLNRTGVTSQAECRRTLPPNGGRPLRITNVAGHPSRRDQLGS